MNIPATNLTALLCSYVEHLYACGRTQNTVMAYSSDLTQFIGYHCARLAPEEASLVTSEHLASFLASEPIVSLKPTTQGRKTTVLKEFFGWLYRHGTIAKNPAAEIVPPKIRIEKSPTVMPVDVRATIETAVMGSRERAILELLALGLLPSEVVSLTLEDIDTVAGWVKTRGNRSNGHVEGRRVDLTTTAWGAVESYIKNERREWLKGRRLASIFANHAGTRMNRQGVWNVLKSAAPDGMPSLTTHQLRQARAVEMLSQGHPLVYVQEQMGHAGPDTTLMYARLASKSGVGPGTTGEAA